jgi:N-acetylglucosaminyldiphosphoundecaprenol N-acetyl-beta-D-mannosaminyltransferase
LSKQLRERQSPDGCFNVLGVRVNAVQIGDVIARMEDWIAQRKECHYVAVTGMHGIMEAHHDPAFKITLNLSNLVVPDGMPLVWFARLKGYPLKRRVYGPELMLDFCEISSHKGYRHFLYGGKPGVAEKLAKELANRFPGLVIAGTYSPPFQTLTEEENNQVVTQITLAAPDVLWVGLSTPKQERWMHEHRSLLNIPVLVGVGAAFDIHSGRKRQAPVWMREHGLEWLFRLLQEPGRLWRRYILYGAEFVFCVALDLLGFRRFE